MEAKYLLILVLLSAVLAFGQVGCMPGGGQSQAQTIGLDFSLMKEAPPSIIAPDTQFQVVAKIENYGDVATVGEFCIEDTIDDVYGGISKSCEYLSIREASDENGRILPREETKMFPSAFDSFMYRDIDNQKASIVATLTYQYSTEASPVICVKDPMRQSPVACPASQSIPVTVKAPLGISKVEKNLFRAAENQVRVNAKFYLKKRVSGDLLLPGAISAFGEEAKNKVLLRGITFGPWSLDCDDENNIIEIKTEKVLSCSGLINVNGVIEHPLNIKMDYAVEVEKVYPIKIEKS